MVFLRSPVLRSQFPRVLKTQPHLGGFPLINLRAYTTAVAGFGAAAGTFLLFFAEEIPVVKKDIFQNLPIIGNYWVKEVAPEDNPF